MAKIFDVQDWLKNHPNRNNFDLTHKVHGSYQFGKLYPVLCKPVVPTDSFRIDTAVSLRFTPMPFPTQSNMRVIFHYFYVRNKNIWKNWANWLQGLEEHTPPYITLTDSHMRNGSLADHLGIQTSYLSTSSEVKVPCNLFYDTVLNNQYATTSQIHVLRYGYSVPAIGLPFSSQVDVLTEETGPFYDDAYYSMLVTAGDMARTPMYFPRLPEVFGIDGLHYTSAGEQQYGITGRATFVFLNRDGIVIGYSYGITPQRDGNNYVYSFSNVVTSPDYPLEDFCIYYCPKGSPDFSTYPSLLYPIDAPLYYSAVFCNVIYDGQMKQIGDTGVTSPYYGSNTSDTAIKVSALPFRAYESIYNAFYRNSQGVQPFQINGVTQYNKYVTNDDDGADSTSYDLFERNWELDAYTSCLISPQQGNVPYVGITDISALGNMRVETPDGNSAEVRLSDNGDGVEISNLRGDTPEARAYALRAASSGFTIPEFREANALQRFLEMNIRKGYKYIDFIEGHFGKKPTYAEMDMPEFIGGFSQRISVNEISNTNGVDNDTLGAIAGQARAIGGSKHGINHYFDDFGFVVGIMCIVPDNAYDSILPKHFNLKNPLDCYFPEFSQLSYMPLTHEELAPLQTINDPRGSSYRDLTKVFGYQRPNHDLVWYPDTVHGLFRDASGIGNSIICRRFGVRPDLSDAFLRIKPEETDTIFNYTFGDNDVALGEIVLSIKAKRPIPRLVVPTIS